MKRLVCPLLALVAVFACGGGHRAFDDDTSRFGVDAGTETPSGTCEGAVRCSRDLRAVVDACDDSNVLTSCGPEEGCANGKCVPACDAAVGADASMGCEFVALPPPRQPETVGSCFAVFLANTWGTPAGIEAEYAGRKLDVATSARIVRTEGSNVTYETFDGELAPGQVAVLFLSQQPSAYQSVACPDGVTTAVSRDTELTGTRRGETFRITTTAPVSAYSIYPFGGAKSAVPTASLLLPLAAWKTDYVVTNPWSVVRNPDVFFSTTQIVAADDDTEITVTGSVHIQKGLEVEGAEKGKPKTYRLRRGEQIQFSQDAELTGTRIAANKKIGVWTGHPCMFIPSDAACCCESSQVQLFPLHSWGREYVAVPYRSRRFNEVSEQYLFRVTGAVDGTTLTYEPKRPKDAPVSLSAGESRFFMTPDPFVVKSQDSEHPFAVYAYMTGNSFAPAQGQDGDPEFTTVLPTEQYLDRYVFFVDPTYPNSQITLVRSREEGKSFERVVLDCAGPLEDWTPLGTSGTYEYTRIWLTKEALPQAVGNGKCGAGRHEIESKGPFGVTVWGTGFAASYAYPGGAALRTINSVEPTVN